MKKIIISITIIAGIALAYSGQKALSAIKRPDLVILDAMSRELNRSLKDLRLEDYQKPYFISYQVKDNLSYQVSGKNGALLYSDEDHTRDLFADVRVGDYQFDSSDNGNSGGNQGILGRDILPLDNCIQAIRNVLWQVTDKTYKKSLEQFFKNKAEKVQKVEKDKIPSFWKEPSSDYIEPEKPFTFDRQPWENLMRKLSAVFNDYDDIYDADVQLSAQKESVYFLNSENSRYVTDEILYSFNIDVSSVSSEGDVISNYYNAYYRHENEIPGEDELKGIVRDVVKETEEISKAEILNPINVPAILEPEAAGIMFHEAVGHRLEGERQNDDSQGQTFTERIGTKIVPSFLSIIDDPTLENFNGHTLLGYYKYDDQGVKGRKVTLVDRGILKNFLLSRTPVKGFSESNGHGRASIGKPPMARMSNLIVKSDKEYSKQKLKELLIEEAKKHNKDFGLIIKKMTGGETNTSSYDFQAFKATPLVIHKVDVKTGKETPVRGVEIVGTPLISINRIVATGNDYRAFNGFCGAESGFVPVSTIAPSILISEIELQKTVSEKEKRPVLKPPK